MKQDNETVDIPKEPQFTTDELLEIWNNSENPVICEKIKKFIQDLQKFVNSKRRNS